MELSPKQKQLLKKLDVSEALMALIKEWTPGGQLSSPMGGRAGAAIHGILECLFDLIRENGTHEKIREIVRFLKRATGPEGADLSISAGVDCAHKPE